MVLGEPGQASRSALIHDATYSELQRVSGGARDGSSTTFRAHPHCISSTFHSWAFRAFVLAAKYTQSPSSLISDMFLHDYRALLDKRVRQSSAPGCGPLPGFPGPLRCPMLGARTVFPRRAQAAWWLQSRTSNWVAHWGTEATVVSPQAQDLALEVSYLELDQHCPAFKALL